MQGIGAGGPPPAGSGQRVVANMGIIVKFPEEGRVVRGRADIADESATVIILPVIRIERHNELRAGGAAPHNRPPADKGGRRRVRRR